MCFMVLLRLSKTISEEIFAEILKELGYEVEVRELDGRRVVEGRRGVAELRASVDKDFLKVETDDYGPRCTRDLDEIVKALYEKDLKPEVIQLVSPYITAYEKRRGKTKKLLEEIGIEAEEVYSSYCG